MTDKVRFEVNGPVGVITNNNPDKRNAFDDDMDARLFEILAELKERPDIRAVIWRGDGKAWSSGHDVSVIGTNVTSLTHHELMTRGHRGILQMFDLDIPIIVAIQGWAIGGSFQRALLCDIRIAAEGTRFMLPEVGHGVIPDTGGVGRLYQMCGPGVVSDLVLTGRVMSAQEALGHGIISRIVAPESLDDVAWEMANKVASSPAVTVKLARRVLAHLSEPAIRTSMADELIYQTFINKSSDFAGIQGIDDGRSRAALHGELRMTELSGLAEPPPLGSAALPAGTYAGQCVFVTGGGTGLGKAIASEFARLGADLVIASRKPEHLDAGHESITSLGARVLTVGCDIRDADQVAAAFDAATEAFAMPSVLVNNGPRTFRCQPRTCHRTPGAP